MNNLPRPTPKFQQYGCQHVRLVKLYQVVYRLWRLGTVVRTYITTMCFPSVLR